MTKKISFQGNLGAYSDLACRKAFPDMETLPCALFSEAFAALSDGRSDLAMIPIDNSIAGRVADIHHLLPQSNLHIIGEEFIPIHHCLLAPRGASLHGLKKVYSHIHALPQCRDFIQTHNLEAIVHGDTAKSAKTIAEKQDPTCAAIASELAAELYDLEILEQNIEDEDHNTTRFIILSRDPVTPPYQKDKTYVTSILFRVRSIPAVLYKALGGFATNGINLTKLESYMVKGHFTAAQFYCDVESHPDDPSLQLALDELGFYAEEIRIVGSYEAHPFRSELN